MARINGHLSEKLYNEELYNLYQILKNINYEGLTAPEPTYTGALWRDDNELKYAYNNQWNSLFSDKFKITSNLTSATLPTNPVYGQLWIDNGTLKYFNGTEFVVVKSEATEQPFDSFSFYNYLQIHNLEPYGDNFISQVNNAAHYSTTIEESAWLYNVDTDTYSFNIAQAEYGLKTDFTYSILAEIFDGNDSYVLQELDDSEYQLAINNAGTITIYIKDAIRCTINLLGTQINNSVDGNTRVDMYLVPNASEDKVFLDGIETQNHKFVNDVTLSLNVDDSNNKNVSLVHVNSDYLSNITENVFYVSADYPYVNIREEFNNSYTEYYIYDMNTNQIRLLNKYEHSPDYVSIPKGIILTNAAIEKYLCSEHANTFVVTLTYEFQSYKTKGEVKKDSNTIYDIESGIYVNNEAISNTILFIDGDYCTDYEVTATDSGNRLFIPNYTGEHDISLIQVPTKITVTSPDFYEDGILYIPESIISDNNIMTPLICVNNGMYMLDDLIYDADNACYRTDLSQETVTKYDIIEINELYAGSGVVGATNYIPCSFELIADGTDYILITNHKFYNNSTLVRNKETGNIYGSSIYDNDLYLLLKNSGDRFLIRSKIASSQIFLDRFDNAVVYIDGSLALNNNQVNFVDYLYNSQIVKNGDSFSIYDADTNTTTALEDTHLLDALNASLSLFTTTHNSIAFSSDNTNGKTYSVYAYKYGNSVEQPLLTGEIDGIEGENVTYHLLGDHQYSLGTNSLAIYVNGIRQYPDSFEETNPISFTLYSSTASKILYVIEPLESNEHRVSQYTVLTQDKKIAGYTNTYTSDITLSNGFIKLYKNGARLSSTEYEVKNPSTIYINEADKDDVFLLEVNGDYLLRELTVPIKFDQNKWVVGKSDVDYNGIPGDDIPETLVSSKDHVMIYINGLAYGPAGSYITSGTQNPKYIQLTDEAKNLLNAEELDNGYITFEWR